MRRAANLFVFVCSLAIAAGSHAAQYTWYVPGAVETPGANNAVFSSSLGLTNLGTAPSSVQISFIPFEGKPVPEPASRQLAVGESLRIDRLLKTLWGLAQDSGTLGIRSDQPLVVSIVTVNTADPKGTYGLGLFPVRDTDLLKPGETGHAIWASQSADTSTGYRTNVNVSLVDPGTSVEVRIYDAAGVLKGQDTATSTTPSTWQRRVADIAGTLAMGRVEFRVTAGRATGYAVVNDNVTSDAIAVQAERMGASPGDFLLDGVAKAPGANATFWSTDVRAFNPGSGPLAVQIEALGFPQRPAPVSWTIPGRGVAEFAGVLQAFGLPDSAGALRFTAGAPFLVYGRTSNGDPTGQRPGTFSASQRAVPFATGFVTPATAFFTGLDQQAGNTGFRTNLALLGGPQGGQGTLVLRDQTGAQLATAAFSRGALEWGQLNVAQWFEGATVPPNARVDAVITSGSLDGYASRIDNGTGDAVVLPISVLPTCEKPTLVLTVPDSACRGSQVTVAWQASDATAKVSIDGLGQSLAASGSLNVTLEATRTLTGRATNACGVGPDVTKTVSAVDTLAILSFGGDPDPVEQGSPFTLEWQLSGSPTEQTLTDSLAGSIPLTPQQRTVTLYPEASGSHMAVLTVTGSCGTDTERTSFTVTPPCTPPSVTRFNASPASITIGQSSTLTLFAAGTSATIQPGNLTISPSGGTVQVSPSTSTTYTVTVVGDCGDSATAQATVNVGCPVVSATLGAGGPTTFCLGGSVTLTGSGSGGAGPYTYEFRNGPATVQNGAANTYQATTAGSYTVVVRDANGCASSVSSAVVVSVSAAPATPTISGSLSFCPGGSTTLTSSAAASYLWSTGATTQSITVSTAGNYTVTVANAAGCTATSAPAVVAISAIPSTVISAPSSTCASSPDNVASVPDAGPGATYVWNISGGSVTGGSGTRSITFYAGASGPVTLSVNVTNAAGCSASSSSTITLDEPPVMSIATSGPTTFCAGGDVTLTAQPSGLASYRWSNGQTSQSITVSAGDSYSVTGTTAAGCSDTSEPVVVTVNADPVAVSLSASPSSIPSGGTSTITFICNGCTNALITASPANNISGLTKVSSNTWTALFTDVSGPNSYTISASGTNSCGTSGSVTTNIDVAF